MKKIKHINLILFQGIFWLSLCNAVFAAENPIQSDIHWRIESPSSFAKGVNILKSDSQNPPTKITLPNLMNGKNYSVSIVWDESWLEGDSFSYNHGLARVLCALSLAAYTNVADSGAYNCLQELYKVLGFSENAIEYHYGVDFSDAELGKDQVFVPLKDMHFMKWRIFFYRVYVAFCETILGKTMADQYYEENENDDEDEENDD